MAKYHGKNAIVYMSATAAAMAVKVLRQTEWSLNTAAATDDVTTFEDSNMHYVQGIHDTVVTLSGVWDDTIDALWDNAGSTGGVRAYLYPSALVMAKYWYGPAWMSFDDISVPVAGAVRTSGTLSALGTWGQF
jgi:hypothetical protein